MRIPFIQKLALTLLVLGVAELRLGGQTTLISVGSTWRYLVTGTDPHSAWRERGFDDSAWVSGPAQLGYGGLAGEGDEATVVGFGPDPQNKYITTYFRHAFTVPNASAFTSLQLRLLYDDGAVAYLNGVEVLRVNMPGTPGTPDIQHSTRALGPEENSIADSGIPAALLVDGANVLAVEIHQVAPDSSDMSFDLALTGTGTTLFITEAPQSLAVNVGSNATFCVTAVGMGPLSYQWRFNGTNIAGATGNCHTRTNAQLADAGSYTVVVSDGNDSVTSGGATLNVIPLRVGWFTLDGGGGASSNSTFTVRGTIGQLDTGSMSNANFTLKGGFWTITAIQTPGAPLLTITRIDMSTVRVSWPSTGFDLQQNNDLNTANWVAPMEPVSDNLTTKSILVIPVGNRFYRLVKP